MLGLSNPSRRLARVASSRSVSVGRRAQDRAEHGAGAGLDQRHHAQRGVSGKAHPVADSTQPGAVAFGVGHAQRVAAIERDGAHPAVTHPGRVRLSQRSGDDLEQRLERGRAETTTQISQRLLRRAPKIKTHQADQSCGELVPYPRIPNSWEQHQREHEVHPDPRRQVAQAALHGLGFGQHVIDQLER
jgi:hypothetical protein